MMPEHTKPAPPLLSRARACCRFASAAIAAEACSGPSKTPPKTSVGCTFPRCGSVGRASTGSAWFAPQVILKTLRRAAACTHIIMKVINRNHAGF